MMTKDNNNNKKPMNRKLSESLKRYYKTHDSQLKGKKNQKTSEGLRRYFATHAHYMKGKKLSPEIVNKMVIGRIKYYNTHGANNKGIPHSNETKQKISESMKAYWLQQRLTFPPRSKFKAKKH